MNAEDYSGNPFSWDFEEGKGHKSISVRMGATYMEPAEGEMPEPVVEDFFVNLYADNTPLEIITSLPNPLYPHPYNMPVTNKKKKDCVEDTEMVNLKQEYHEGIEKAEAVKLKTEEEGE